MVFPDESVLHAFGIVGAPEVLESGTGRRCYTVNNIVLRPLNDDDEVEVKWTAWLVSRLPRSNDYRVPRPLLANVTQTTLNTAETDEDSAGHEERDGTNYIYNGWMAQNFLSGRAGTRNLEEFVKILRVSRALHRDLTELRIKKPAFLNVSSNLGERKRNRWREADTVVWGEKKLEDVPNVTVEAVEYFEPIIRKLKALLKTMPSEEIEDHQIIHSDLNGNVLFELDSPLGIIDFTPSWRPAKYAEAIVVADALVWYRHVLNGNEEDLLREFGLDEALLQLLVRAVYWKCLMFCIRTDFESVKQRVARADYEQAVQLLEEIITRTGGLDDKKTYTEDIEPL